MSYCILSEYKDSSTTIADNIFLVQQFFVHKDEKRRKEIVETLKKNISLELFDKILLLNERKYTKEEMGLSDDEMKKITQIIVGNRLRYGDFFRQIKNMGLSGYYVLANSDIFFDKTIVNLFRTDLSINKSCIALLRYEYNNEKNLNNCKLYGPRSDAQDTWIIHSNFIPDKKIWKTFDFHMGFAGCDNKIAYLFYILGYNVYNIPEHIRSYHFHQTGVREYLDKAKISRPYLFVYPTLSNVTRNNIQSYLIKYQSSSKFDNYYLNFLKKKCVLHDVASNWIQRYILGKLEKNTPFIIPKLGCIETILSTIISQKRELQPIVIQSMCIKAGIYFSSENSIKNYVDQYMLAFELSDTFTILDPTDETSKLYQGSFIMGQDYFIDKYSKSNYILLSNLDIFYQVYNSFTLSLRGKRILIVSSMIDSISKQVSRGSKIFNNDLFPECTFVYVRSPYTGAFNHKNIDWQENFQILCKEVESKKDEFDVALCACGGYGNPLLTYIYKIGKSAIYMGEILQMFFGILGKLWEKDCPDAIDIFKNDLWIRPLAHEIPPNNHLIENGCY